ncbi:PspC domain-containing protein [Alkaliphilus hydrothermalis]|uniref:Phage shock protein PspC (Stress-responsive transcriptional regulator) n=1 Tax=Alkaliphilus hydrothermalis TaxID=1482730 RepID=A0ABS2NKL8_9FIRM|nr:PspC domain-containing protein [Alkaliphilus hydrothermalis]MBM7613500.1 phage shock protein PspC (stress-responsive transcriptional regulator) [Alkaliphilus hydrothermalis]
MQKRLYKSRHDKKLFGVCGGVAEYFGIDSTLVRLGLVLLTLMPVGSGIILYILAAIIMNEEPRNF